MVAKVVIDGDVRIAGELGALLADGLVDPEILGVHRVVGFVLERPQQHAAPCVKRGAAGEVRVPGDEVDDRAHFRLRRRIGTGIELLELLSPLENSY